MYNIVKFFLSTLLLLSLFFYASSAFAQTTPQIDSFDPDTLTASDDRQYLYIYGSGFTSATKIDWENGSKSGTIPDNRTRYYNTGKIRIYFRTTLDGHGKWYFTPKNGNVKGNRKSFTVQKADTTPTPQIDSFDPDTLTASEDRQYLYLYGSGFTEDIEVDWENGDKKGTIPNSNTGSKVRYYDEGKIRLYFRTTLDGHGRWYFTARNDDKESNRKRFTVEEAKETAPQIDSFDPDTLTASDSRQYLTIHGSGFTKDTVIGWENGDKEGTIPNSNTGSKLDYIDDDEIRIYFRTTRTGHGKWYFTPRNGNVKGNRKSFTVKEAKDVPQIDSFDPGTLTASNSYQYLTLNGSGFTEDTEVDWENGSKSDTIPDSRTEYKNSGQIRIRFKTTLAGYGTWHFTPRNGNTKGSRAQYTVQKADTTPTPQISSFDPTTLTAKDGDQTLTLKGSGFTRDTIVKWRIGNNSGTLKDSSEVTFVNSSRIQIHFNTTQDGYGTWYFTPQNGDIEGSTTSFVIKKPTSFSPKLSNTQNLPAVCKNGKQCITTSKKATLKFRVTDADGDLSRLDVDWDGEGSAESKHDLSGGDVHVTSTYTFSDSAVSGCSSNASYRYNGGCWKKDLTLTATAYDEAGNASKMFRQSFLLYDSDKYDEIRRASDEAAQDLESERDSRNNHANDENRYRTDTDELTNTCSAKKGSQASSEELRPKDPFRVENGSPEYCRTGGNTYTLHRCSVSDRQCSISAEAPVASGVDYEILVHYDLSNKSNDGKCINYPARVISSYTVDGTKSIFERQKVNNYQQKADYLRDVTFRLKLELQAKSAGRYYGKCNIGDYKEWTLEELENEVQSHSSFDAAVNKYVQTYGVSSAEAIRGVRAGVAKATHEIIHGYAALPEDVKNLIGGSLSMVGRFIDDPSGTAQDVKNGVTQTTEAAIQIAAEIAEITPELPDAIAHLSLYKKAYFSAYISAHIAHELAPTGRLKLLRINGTIKRPLWLEKALITVRLHKIRNGGNVSVYISYDPTKGKAWYVGITNDIKRRGREHLKKKEIVIEKVPGLDKLSREDAKACEQFLINLYGLPKDDGQLLHNQINSIAKVNEHFDSLIEVRGKVILDSVNFDYEFYRQ